MSREAAAKRREENEVEFSRIVAFSDGVFSIAITLLVLSLELPKDLANGEVGHAIWEQREHFFAYGISFAVIARFWVVHHRFFGEVAAFDGRLIALNMVYLAFIALMPFSTQVLGEYGDASASVLLYAGNLLAVVVLSFVMAADARRAGLTTISAADHRKSRLRVAWIVFVFGLSIPVALIDAHIAPFCWLLLFVDPASRFAGSRDG